MHSAHSRFARQKNAFSTKGTLGAHFVLKVFCCERKREPRVQKNIGLSYLQVVRTLDTLEGQRRGDYTTLRERSTGDKRGLCLSRVLALPRGSNEIVGEWVKKKKIAMDFYCCATKKNPRFKAHVRVDIP